MKKVLNIIEQKANLIVWALIGLYILIFSFFCIWKFNNFFYNVMDLAIINQVFFNSSIGSWFSSSIHPPSYLGDHFTPIIFLLLPFYLIKKSPESLLILQTIFLALSAWPLFLIAKNNLDKKLAILISIAWLVNPFVQNINLFEFHFLPIAIFFILFSFYFYQKEKFLVFLTFSFLALAVREDVILVILMFSVLAWLDKKDLKFKLTPLLLAVGYFILIIISKNIAGIESSYKFFIYYSWLGSNPITAIQNAIFEPWRVFGHLFKIGNLEFIIGLFLPLIFLPLLSPKYLILGLLILLQLIMRTDGATSTLLETHYSALVLPTVFISAIFGLKKIKQKEENKIINFINEYQGLIFLIFIVGLFYSMLTLGPILGINKKINKDILNNNIIKKIPASSSVATSYKFLTPLSSRKNIYSFNYIFLGQQQYLKKEYNLPENTEYILFDYSDLLTYQLQYGNNSFYQERYIKAVKKFPVIFKDYGLVSIKGLTALYKKNQPNSIELIKIVDNTTIDNPQNIILNENITFVGHNKKENYYQLFWKLKEPIGTGYYLEVVTDNGSIVYPFTYGENIEIEEQKMLQTNFWFEAKENFKFKLIKVIKGGIEINNIRSTKNVIDEKEEIGPEISIQ